MNYLQKVIAHYEPGNVVYVSYWNQFDLVKEFQIDGTGSWWVQVVECDQDGNVKPGARIRTHATPPMKGDHIAKLAS